MESDGQGCWRPRKRRNWSRGKTGKQVSQRRKVTCFFFQMWDFISCRMCRIHEGLLLTINGWMQCMLKEVVENLKPVRGQRGLHFISFWFLMLCQWHHKNVYGGWATLFNFNLSTDWADLNIWIYSWTNLKCSHRPKQREADHIQGLPVLLIFKINNLGSWFFKKKIVFNWSFIKNLLILKINSLGGAEPFCTRKDLVPKTRFETS